MNKNSWLYSDSFLKRCFAIWGHFMVAHLIIMIPFMLIWVILFATVFVSVLRSDGVQKALQNAPAVQQDLQVQ